MTYFLDILYQVQNWLNMRTVQCVFTQDQPESEPIILASVDSQALSSLDLSLHVQGVV